MVFFHKNNIMYILPALREVFSWGPYVCLSAETSVKSH